MTDTQTKDRSTGSHVDQQNMIERIHLELGKLNPERLERVENFIAFERAEQQRKGSSATSSGPSSQR
jgi:hypothetical protein